MNERISAYLAERIAANDFPSAVYLVAEKGEIVFHDALGNAVVEPELIPAKLDTIYDLASLTKPLVTGLLATRLVERNLINLDDDAGHILTNAPHAVASQATLGDLATHRSGYPAWMPFYLLPGAPPFDPEDYGSSSANIDRICEYVRETILRFEARGHAPVVYSDLNFILIGFILELFSDLPLATQQLEINERLRLQRTLFRGPGAPNHETAASEFGNRYERQTCIEKFPELGVSESAFRNYQIWGEVHDGNAYFMGGVAGHAGLFSTAEEVFKIALQFLPEHTKLLKPETCELFRTNFTPGMNEDRSFAFQLASTKDSTAGTRMSPESFGHNGFTGTSLWIDPVKDRIFVLLTNRTHAHPLPFVNINSVRRRFHDLAIEELEKN